MFGCLQRRTRSRLTAILTADAVLFAINVAFAITSVIAPDISPLRVRIAGLILFWLTLSHLFSAIFVVVEIMNKVDEQADAHRQQDHSAPPIFATKEADETPSQFM